MMEEIYSKGPIAVGFQAPLPSGPHPSLRHADINIGGDWRLDAATVMGGRRGPCVATPRLLPPRQACDLLYCNDIIYLYN